MFFFVRHVRPTEKHIMAFNENDSCLQYTKNVLPARPLQARNERESRRVRISWKKFDSSGTWWRNDGVRLKAGRQCWNCFKLKSIYLQLMLQESKKKICVSSGMSKEGRMAKMIYNCLISWLPQWMMMMLVPQMCSSLRFILVSKPPPPSPSTSSPSTCRVKSRINMAVNTMCWFVVVYCCHQFHFQPSFPP